MIKMKVQYYNIIVGSLTVEQLEQKPSIYQFKKFKLQAHQPSQSNPEQGVPQNFQSSLKWRPCHVKDYSGKGPNHSARLFIVLYVPLAKIFFVIIICLIENCFILLMKLLVQLKSRKSEVMALSFLLTNQRHSILNEGLALDSAVMTVNRL